MSDDSEIERIAESYRVKLGMRTWDEQSAYAISRGAFGGRRSGRTARGLLRALALCQIEGARTLTVEASPAANRDYCIRMARDMIDRLGMGLVTVLPDRMGVGLGRGLCVSYVDHHNPTHVMRARGGL